MISCSIQWSPDSSQKEQCMRSDEWKAAITLYWVRIESVTLSQWSLSPNQTFVLPHRLEIKDLDLFDWTKYLLKIKLHRTERQKVTQVEMMWKASFLIWHLFLLTDYLCYFFPRFSTCLTNFHLKYVYCFLNMLYFFEWQGNLSADPPSNMWLPTWKEAFRETK